MFVTASTECFPDLGPEAVLEQLIDLGFTSVELALNESAPGGWMKPSEVLSEPDAALKRCGSTARMDIAAITVQIDAEGEPCLDQFEAVCKLAKALKVVTLVVPSSPLGTPFNEEIEKLKKMVALAALEGAVVALKTEIDCMTQDLDTAVVFCQHVKGLGLALDPSCYTTGPHKGKAIDKVLPYVRHVHLRDSTKDEIQVRVGQGEIDYGKLITQLQRAKYRRALSIHMTPIEGLEHAPEVRKLRLLLDSLL
ncbi:Xylose isomerase-like TIM barrel [Botrimarina colliarenosi]|uniref:Xylose isomerase-like TIM barrel n=1 Tax=Botrimarina colliarenosi TaxID=2528001 RepID=A0A5C6AEP7_9BACT|nr:sugar phosphate isomerase/epimerase [Botrimarina colliarenosi]TWT96703.1 Xylose isomerase-like TIM barrel [Botrimarina colliarenosi]